MAKPPQREFHDEDREKHRQDQRAEDPLHHATKAGVRLGFVVEIVGHYTMSSLRTKRWSQLCRPVMPSQA
jgi:hypothetical protein